MKIDGLRTIQALAQHHPEVLKAKLHEVCVVIIEEVLYTLSSVQPLFVFNTVSLADICLWVWTLQSWLMMSFSYYTGEKPALSSCLCSYEHLSWPVCEPPEGHGHRGRGNGQCSPAETGGRSKCLHTSAGQRGTRCHGVILQPQTDRERSVEHRGKRGNEAAFTLSADRTKWNTFHGFCPPSATAVMQWE